MAITFPWANSYQSTTQNATAATLTLPADVQDGDIAYAVYTWVNSTSTNITSPTTNGWTEVQKLDIDDGMGGLYSKTLTAADANQVQSFNYSGQATKKSLSIVIVRGATVGDTQSWSYAAGITTATIPAGTGSASSESLALFALNSTGNANTLAGWTVLTEVGTAGTTPTRTEIWKKDATGVTSSETVTTNNTGKAVWRVVFEPAVVTVNDSFDADTPTASLASQDVTVDITNPNAEVVLDTAAMSIAGIDESAGGYSATDLTTATVSAVSNDVTVETQQITIVEFSPSADFTVDSAGTITNDGIVRTDGSPAERGIFKFDGLIPQGVQIHNVTFSYVLDSLNTGVAPQLGVVDTWNTANYYNTAHTTAINISGNTAFTRHNVDLTSSIDTATFKGLKLFVAGDILAYRIVSSDNANASLRPVLRVSYSALPSVTVDVDSPAASLAAVEPTVDTINPVNETVDLDTVSVSLNTADATFEELRTAILVPTVDGYRSQGGTSFTNTGDVLSITYDPTVNLSSVLLPQGTDAQKALVNSALERFDFPLETLQSAIQAKYGRNYVPVEFTELGPGESGGSVLGQFISNGTIALDISLTSTLEVRSTLIHEIAHLVDDCYLTNAQRVSIWNALHPNPAEHLAPGTLVQDGVALSHGHYWSGGGDYADRVEEAFANAFVKAYSDSPLLGSFSHEATVEAADAIRRIITPSLPAMIGPFPTRTPAIRMHFDPIPGEAVTGSIRSATLGLNVTWNTGGQYTVRIIEPQARLANESASKTISLSTGANNIDVSDILDPEHFGIVHIGNVKGGTSQTLNMTSTEDTVVGTEPTISITYAVNHGATVADAETATLSAATQEPVVEATTSPDVFVDVTTPAIVIPEPQAQVVLHVALDLSNTDTVMLGAYDADIELNNSAVVELDTPSFTITRIPVTDVNGEPVLPTETEDPYFVATMQTMTGRLDTGGAPIAPAYMTWFRMNEGSGTVAYDRLYDPSAPVEYGQAKATADLHGVVIGLNNGPEGRPNFGFTGDSYMSVGTAGTSQAAANMEFSFRTTKATQFLVGGYKPAGTEINSINQPWELWLVDGYLEVRQIRRALNSARQVVTTETKYRGSTKLDDGNWHHVVWQKSYAVTETRYIDGVATTLTPGEDETFQMEIFVDAKVDLRRRIGISPRGVVTHVGGKPDGALDQSYWFKGDMTEFISRDGRVLTQDEVARQRDAMFGINAVWTQGGRLQLASSDATVKGNKPRLLVLHFGGSDGDYRERQVSFSWEPQAISVPLISPETLWRWGDGRSPRSSSIVFAGLGDKIQHYDFVTGEHWPDYDLTEFHEYVIWDKVYKGLFTNARRDPVTDNYRLIDLDVDLNMDDFDVISIVGYPATESDFARYDVLDAYNAEPYTPARKQLEHLMGQIKAQVVDHGKGLFVADPFSAIALGIIDQVDVVPEYYEERPRELLDLRLGAVNPGYDGHALATDPFTGAAAKTIQEMVFYLDSVDNHRAAGNYTDTHANHKQRVRAIVDGLTDQPGYIRKDIIEWVNTNPVNDPPYQLSVKYENKQMGLEIGDEFYIDAPTVMRSEFYNSNLPSMYAVWKHTGRRVAAPMGAVKVGTVVTSYLSYFHAGMEEAARAYREGGGSDAKGNPFYNHAISIAIQPGDVWDGKVVQGKVYINFTESMQMFAMQKHMAPRLKWDHLDGDGLDVYQDVRTGEGYKFTITPQMAEYQYSTHYGSWGGTEIQFNKKTKPDWGWSAGGVRGSGLSGGGGEAINWSWKPATDLVMIHVPTMSERGLVWLTKDITIAGNVSVHTEAAKVTAAANDVVVETTSHMTVDLSTARTTIEAHVDMDTVDPDVSVLVPTPAAVVKAGSVGDEVTLEAARVLLAAKTLEPEAVTVDWPDAILLTLPRQIATLILEDN